MFAGALHLSATPRQQRKTEEDRVMSIRNVIAFAALSCAGAAHSASYDFNQVGTVQVDAGASRAATLHLGCSPDNDGGALSIELIVTEANTRKDFDYDDFEGPDAPAGDKALSQIAWRTSAGTDDISHAAAGSYIPDPAEAFTFSVSQLSHHREAPAKLLSAIGAAGGTLVWTQSGFGKDTRKLVGKFDFDAAAAKKAHDAVVTCLPINSPRKPNG